MNENTLEHYLNDELEDAEKYAMKAFYFKTSHQDLAKIFLEMSKDELKHAQNVYSMLASPGEALSNDFLKRSAEIAYMQSM